ncbi:MAG: alanine:cation symporter family protein, partial [Streptococcaceae bacterium]|nr:alanine:cation symporter family protein [Streptococcaceae bacterium]
IATAIFIAAVNLRGVEGFAKVAEKIMPLSAAVIFIITFIAIGRNFSAVPNAFYQIVTGAFSYQAAAGGFLGAGIMIAMRFGVARGVFSNEAGLGSAPIYHAKAKTDHPVKQGMWGALEVFIDTHVICTLVALVIITSGYWTYVDAAGVRLVGAPLVVEAFNSAVPGFGGWAITIAIVLFGSTTIAGWGFYGEKGLEYLFGTKTNMAYRLLWIGAVVLGSLGNLSFVWAFTDVFAAFMLVPNLISVFALGGVVSKLTKDFFAGNAYVSHYERELQLAAGITPAQQNAIQKSLTPETKEVTETV